MTTRRACLAAMLGMAAMPFPILANERQMSIVAAHFAVAQTMLAMDIAPCAVPLKQLYRQMGILPALPDSVIDVGLATEPNVELLLDLAPDAIVIGSGQDRLVPLFETFSRVIRTQFAHPDDHPYDLAVRETVALAKILQAEDRATRLIDATEESIRQCKSNLIAGNPPVYVVTLMPDGRHATVWGQGSLANDVLAKLGIANAWSDPVQGWGTLTIGVEQLGSDEQAGLIYIENPDAPLALKRLSQSPLWTNLPFARKGRLAAIGGFYPYGGLPAAVSCAEGLTRALNALQSPNG